MSAPLPVRIVSSAARSIAEVAAWWTANRPKAPDAFVDDLERTLTLIASHPNIGARARNAKLENARRVLSHGKQDPILPIKKCGRRIAADLDARA